MELNSGIYKITNKVNGKIYIGQSRDLVKRRNKFFDFEVKYGGEYINNARKKYNSLDNWNYEVLEYCELEKLDEREIFFIEFFNSTDKNIGYNLRTGGNNGFEITEETRKRLSDSHKGQQSWLKGKHLSEEHKRKVSNSKKGQIPWNKGIPWSEETKEKIRKSKSNISDELRKKLSDSHKGKVFTEEERNKIYGYKMKPIYQIDKESGEIIKEWKNAGDVERELNYLRGHINSCCNNKRKSAYGFKWCFVEDYLAA